MHRDKITIIGLVIVLVFLFINMLSTVLYNIDYEKRKESGNDRWLQVENRLIQMEEKINTLEEELQWKK